MRSQQILPRVFDATHRQTLLTLATMETSEKERLDADYAPSRLVPSIDDYLRAYGDESREAREWLIGHGHRLVDARYGDRERESLHLILPTASTRPCPLVVFIHGGFWQALSRDESLYPAPVWIDAGVAYAAIGYNLAPAVSLSTIVDQVKRAVAWLFSNAATMGIDDSRIVLVGHSAGAQLAAMCAIDDSGGPPLAGVVLVGGVFELEPISRCYVNDKLNLSEAEIRSLSPSRLTPRTRTNVSIIYGENETRAFKNQSQALAAAWRDVATIHRVSESPGYNHFDLIQQLGNPNHDIYKDAAFFLSLDR